MAWIGFILCKWWETSGNQTWIWQTTLFWEFGQALVQPPFWVTQRGPSWWNVPMRLNINKYNEPMIRIVFDTNQYTFAFVSLVFVLSKDLQARNTLESKLVTPIYKSFRPFGRGTTPVRWRKLSMVVNDLHPLGWSSKYIPGKESWDLQICCQFSWAVFLLKASVFFASNDSSYVRSGLKLPWFQQNRGWSSTQ